MSQSFDLLTLQEIDNEAAAIHAAIESMEARLKGNVALGDARRELQYVEEELRKRRSRQRRVEADIDEVNAKLVPEEKRLYGGSITNPKELESLQKELAFLAGVRSGHEERLFKVLSEIEDLTPRLKAARQSVETLEQEWEAAQLSLRQELRQVTDNLGGVERRRNEQKAKILPRTLGLYEELRPRKGGVAVAPIKAGACSSCRVSLPGAVRSKTLDKDAVVQCPNCERILTPG